MTQNFKSLRAEQWNIRLYNNSNLAEKFAEFGLYDP